MRTMQSRRCCALVTRVATIALVVDILVGSIADANDVVRVARQRDGSVLEIAGEVTYFDRDTLRITTSRKRLREFDTTSILSTQTTLSTNHIDGRRHLDNGNWSEAIEELEVAVQRERRDWVRQHVLRDLAFAYRFSGDLERSAAIAFALLGEFPRTNWLDALPLKWDNARLNRSLQRKALGWMLGERPEAQLLGASWLLSGASRRESLRRLQQLTGSTEGWIAQLATAQLWRTEMDAATSAQCVRWARLIERLPRPLRAGPLTILGRAWRHTGNPEKAAIALMKVPILHTDEKQLAVKSLMQVAQLVETDERAAVYREVVRTFGYTEEAMIAKHELQPTQKKRAKPDG